MSWSWLVLLATVIIVLVKHKISTRKNALLPPGPPADPLIGHLRIIPLEGQDMFFYKLGLKYGDVTHLKVLGQTLIILNSVQAAVELLDKRGTNYSDRPSFPIYDLLGLDNTLPFIRYGPEWRAQRKMVQQPFSKEKAKEYRHIQTREARILVQNLLSMTEDRLRTCLRFSTAVIIDINYGHQVESNEDPYLKVADNCCRLVAESGPPGATPIDVFPFLRHFPSWFPGTFYATFARNASPEFNKLFQYPYNQMKMKMAKGPVKHSFLASMLEKLHREGQEDEQNIKRAQIACGVVYLAGAETTSSTLAFFLLAMVLYPEIQIKAQEEMDAVLGAGRLPEFDNRENLPYVESILQETLRWNQAVPTGVPHKSMEDDTYNGMLIPKGSIIIPNARAMTLDETVYKDPFKFDPTRYFPSLIGRGEPPPTGQFGFGRRICPGRYLAEDSLWIAIATILATTTISRVVGEDGKEIVPDATVVVTGVSSHPIPFKCHIKPRSETALKVLQRAVEIDST